MQVPIDHSADEAGKILEQSSAHLFDSPESGGRAMMVSQEVDEDCYSSELTEVPVVEVTRDNIGQLGPNIKQCIRDSDVIAIDCVS